MHISVRMTIHIIIAFRHAHICTNDYPYYYIFCHAQLCTNDYVYYYRFSSCTSLYEWLSILLYVFVMHISVRMTIHNILDSVIHISVRTTIHIIIGFRTAHLFTKDYAYSYWFLSCEWLWIFLLVFVMHILLRRTIHISIRFRHAHLYTNDYPYPSGFSSCTSLFEWLSIFLLVFVMHIFVHRTILFSISFQCVSIKPEYFYVSLLF